MPQKCCGACPWRERLQQSPRQDLAGVGHPKTLRGAGAQAADHAITRAALSSAHSSLTPQRSASSPPESSSTWLWRECLQ